MPEPTSDPPAEVVPPAKLQWGDVREAGSYLHVASGLIARVYPEDLEAARAQPADAGGGPVVRLDPNPGAPMSRLREIAQRLGLRITS